MITITSVDSSGKIFTRLYDNKRANFSSPDGVGFAVRFDTGQRPPSQKPPSQQQSFTGQVSASPENLSRIYKNVLACDTKSKHIKLLKIQLGLSCNYSCTYCKQAVHVEGSENSSMKDADDFIASFDNWCDTPADAQINIQLWGGEPFVYFAKIKKLVPFLRSRFSNARISTLSNGSMINKEIVDFLIDHKVILAISHDGEGQITTRKDDPLAEGSESLKWIRDYISRAESPLYVNMVLSKQNHDPLAGIAYIKSILGDNVNAGYEGIVTVEDEGQFDQTSIFSDEDYYHLRRSFKDAMRTGEIRNISPFNRKFDSLMNDWSNPSYELRDDFLSKCGMDDPYTLAVTLKGDALVCHSTSNVIGSVYDHGNIKLSNGGVTHWSQKPECTSCPVLTMCRGACMNLHDNAWFYTCNNEFHFNMAIFEAAYEVVFNESIIHIDGFDRPMKKLTIPIKAV